MGCEYMPTAEDRKRDEIFSRNLKLRNGMGSLSLGHFSVSELPAILRVLKVEAYPQEVGVWEAKVKSLKAEQKLEKK